MKERNSKIAYYAKWIVVIVANNYILEKFLQNHHKDDK